MDRMLVIVGPYSPAVRYPIHVTMVEFVLFLRQAPPSGTGANVEKVTQDSTVKIRLNHAVATAMENALLGAIL